MRQARSRAIRHRDPIPPGVPGAEACDVQVQADGRILLLANHPFELADHVGLLIRLTDAGELDTSFNGRGFDIPFLLIRSAVHKIKPTKNLMSNRYLNSQKFDSKHVDLLDQLTFYEAARRWGNLHLWCRAFGVESPKSLGVTGETVGKLFKEKRFLEIIILFLDICSCIIRGFDLFVKAGATATFVWP